MQIYKQRIADLLSLGLRSCSNFLLTKIGCNVTAILILLLRSRNCLRTVLEAIWSLKGRTILIVLPSSVFFSGLVVIIWINILTVDCEQTLFFFRFSKRLAHAHQRASPVSRLQSRAWSFACLGRFARRTKKKERLLVVYINGRIYEANWIIK